MYSFSVNLTGFLQGEELNAIYGDSDIFLLPSYHPEGFPYTIIEAMGSGLVVVASSKGALSEIIVNGVTGFKVAPGNIDELVAVINKLSDSPQLRERIGRNNHIYFKKYLSKGAAERFYENLLDQYVW